MKVSRAWLEEFVPISLDNAVLAQTLTAAGLEVESVEAVAPPFTGVVVGEIVSIAPHPNAQKLTICSVDTGESKPLNIVCGASNVRPGIKVAVAREGAVLPNDVVIRAATLRGVRSEGMVCSAAELGLRGDAQGILELAAELAVGRELRSALNLEDVVLDLKSPANRGDCLSVAGVAREMRAILQRRYWEPMVQRVQGTLQDVQAVHIEATEACPAFASRIVRNIPPGAKAPSWMIERLQRAGMNSISAVVDVTNYVMLELGQPLHAYDLQKLGSQLIVRWARGDEHLELLSGDFIALDPQCLIIASDTTPVGLAGIYGGRATAISDHTQHVVLESAHFTPSSIIGRARRFGLFTDAAQRFERGVDPTLVPKAIERATQLLLQLSAAAGPVSLSGDARHVERWITLRASRLDRLLGLELPKQEVFESLASISPEVRSTTDGWQVRIPAHRFDLNIEADLIEEVLRLTGMNRVAVKPAEIAQLTGPADEREVPLRGARDHLAARGYREAITYSFISSEENSSLFPDETPLALSNAISGAMSTMRTSLWPGLLRACEFNVRHQQERVKLFEAGRTYHAHASGPLEIERMSALICGARLPEQWSVRSKESDFFDLKGDLESLLSLARGNGRPRYVPDQLSCLHPGRAARIWMDDQPVGWIGELHPKIAARMGLPAVQLFEIDTALCLHSKPLKFNGISEMPSVRRDLSVVLDDAIAFDAICRSIRRSDDARLIQDIVLFDVFRGGNLDSGRKSIAFGLILQDPSRTLVDHEIEEVVARVVGVLKKEFGAVLRE